MARQRGDGPPVTRRTAGRPVRSYDSYMRTAIFSLAILLAAGAGAETTIGNYLLSTNSSTVNFPQPNTVIDVSSGATANGNIGAVAVRFNRSECTGAAFKVKFFRRAGNDYNMTTERGPFAITGSLTKVVMTPPVPVLQGDVLGITELKECAGTVGQTPLLFKNAYHFQGDITTTSSLDARWLPSFALAAYGAESAASEIRTQVIIAAGAAAGVGGSSFKTDIFLGNLRGTRSAGRLVYHPAGVGGSPSDPSYAFAVDQQRSLNLPNFVGTTLGRSGVGSIDVYTTIGFEAPTIAARIYDDAGAAGTKGFTLEGLTPSSALQPFENAILFTPLGPGFRMNMGVRTLEATEVQFLHLDASGTQRAFVTKSYPADYFIQGLVRDFTGVNPQPGDTVIVYSQQKPFFAYGSIIDNASNDPSVQVAKHLK